MYTVFASDPISQRFYARHPGIWQRTLDLVKQLEDRGSAFGSFGVGFDSCMEDQFDVILEFCEKASIKTAEFFIATPFPGTAFWEKIKVKIVLSRPIGGNLIVLMWCSNQSTLQKNSFGMVL